MTPSRPISRSRRPGARAWRPAVQARELPFALRRLGFDQTRRQVELHLRIEIIELPGEILDHEVDVGNLAPLFLGAETVQPEERLA